LTLAIDVQAFADRLTAVIESRMSSDLAWLRDDGKTVDRFTPEQVGWAIAHLYLTGDVVSGLPPLDEEAAL
jgi:anaerobic glycerol-3-phosphate dehydrogenase